MLRKPEGILRAFFCPPRIGKGRGFSAQNFRAYARFMRTANGLKKKAYGDFIFGILDAPDEFFGPKIFLDSFFFFEWEAPISLVKRLEGDWFFGARQKASFNPTKIGHIEQKE